MLSFSFLASVTNPFKFPVIDGAPSVHIALHHCQDKPLLVKYDDTQLKISSPLHRISSLQKRNCSNKVDVSVYRTKASSCALPFTSVDSSSCKANLLHSFKRLDMFVSMSPDII